MKSGMVEVEVHHTWDERSYTEFLKCESPDSGIWGRIWVPRDKLLRYRLARRKVEAAWRELDAAADDLDESAMMKAQQGTPEYVPYEEWKQREVAAGRMSVKLREWTGVSSCA